MTDKVLIAGVGNSPFGKLTGRTPLDLEVEAAVKAMEDAGLNPQDVDGLAVLILYVFLLGLGTVGEVWDIEWILDLPIFRPPGKY